LERPAGLLTTLLPGSTKRLPELVTLTNALLGWPWWCSQPSQRQRAPALSCLAPDGTLGRVGNWATSAIYLETRWSSSRSVTSQCRARRPTSCMVTGISYWGPVRLLALASVVRCGQHRLSCGAIAAAFDGGRCPRNGHHSRPRRAEPCSTEPRPCGGVRRHGSPGAAARPIRRTRTGPCCLLVSGGRLPAGVADYAAADTTR